MEAHSSKDIKRFVRTEDALRDELAEVDMFLRCDLFCLAEEL